MEKITSLQNLKIKNIIKLRKTRERNRQNLIIIEGKKEIEMALAGGIKLVNIFYCPALSKDNQEVFFDEFGFDEDLTIIVNTKIFKKISYRDNPDGFLALAKPEYMKLKDLQFSNKLLIVALEAVEKPGNLGAILRTADAVGVDAVIINDSKIDIFNPNAIRASRGTIFTVPVVITSCDETIKFFKNHKIKSYATSLLAQKNYTKIAFENRVAIIFGTEDKGLSGKWMKHADEFIKISMQGEIDSLNVSVSAGIILYEIKRQKDK